LHRCEAWSHTGGKQGAEEDTWVYKGQGNGSGAGYTTRSFMICTATPNTFQVIKE